MKKISVFVFLCLTMMVVFAFAQGAAAGSAPAKADAAAEKACPPYDDINKKANASPIADVIDKNKDGKLTHEEWQAAGAPENSFKFFMAKDKDKKGYVSREEYLAETPPDGIDADCDGKITITEFQAFDRKMSAGGTAPGNVPATK